MPRQLTLNVTTRHDGRVCKRIDGRLRTWANAEEARKEILALIAVREGSAHAADVAAVPVATGPATIREVFNAFLEDREAKAMAGKIKKGTFLDYKDALESFIGAIETWKPDKPDLISALKRIAPTAALTPAVFAHVRIAQGAGVGSYVLDRRIQGVRTAFKWAFDVPRLVPATPHYGDAYHKPSHADKRADKRRNAEKNGERRFTAAEVQKIVRSKLLTGPIKPMVWLALNGGMYAADCATLRWGDIKREGRYQLIDTYREKTQVRQRFVLWAETVKALNEWKPKRPMPRDPANADLVFVTARGNPFVNETIRRDATGRVIGGANVNTAGQEFDKLLETLDLKRTGRGFGAFRHTHISAAARCSDVNARMVVRGHQVVTIEAHYDFQDIDRLKAVTDTVYSTLIKSKPQPSSPGRRQPKPSRKRTRDRR